MGIFGRSKPKQQAWDDKQAPQLTLERVVGNTLACGSAVAFAEDGSLAYAAGKVVLLQPAGASPDAAPRFLQRAGSGKSIRCLAFSEDGRYLAAGEDGRQTSILVWDLHRLGSDDQPIAELRGHKYSVASLSFCPRGRYLVSCGTSHEGALFLWDVAQVQLVCKQSAQAELRNVAFVDDGRAVASVGRFHFTVWSCGEGSEKRKSSQASCSVRLMPRPVNLAERREELFVAVVVGPPPSHQPTQGKSGRAVAAAAAAAASSGIGQWMYAVTAGGQVGAIRAGGRNFERWADAQVREAYCLAASPTTVACGGSDGAVRLFAAKTLVSKGSLPKPVVKSLQELTLSLTGTGHTYPDAHGCSFDPSGGRLVVSYADRSIHVWDVSNPKRAFRAASVLGHSAPIYSVASLPAPMPCADSGGKCGDVGAVALVASASADGSIRLWDVSSGPPSAGASLSKVICPAPDMGPGGAQGRVYRDRNGALQRTRSGVCRVTFRSLAVSPGGAHLAAGDAAGVLRVFDAATLGQVYSKELHQGDITACAFGPLQRRRPGSSKAPGGGHQSGGWLLATGGLDGRVQVLQGGPRGYVPMQRISVGQYAVSALSFSQEGGAMVVCGRDKSVSFWLDKGHPTNFVAQASTVPSKSSQASCALVPDSGCAVTVGQDRRVRVWDVYAGRQVKAPHFEADLGAEPLCVCADPSGCFVGVADAAQGIRLLDVKTGALLAFGRGHQGPITGLAVTPDCCRIVSVGTDGCVYVWALPDRVVRQCQARGTPAPPKRAMSAAAKARAKPVAVPTVAVAAVPTGGGNAVPRLRLPAKGVAAADTTAQPTTARLLEAVGQPPIAAQQQLQACGNDDGITAAVSRSLSLPSGQVDVATAMGEEAERSCNGEGSGRITGRSTGSGCDSSPRQEGSPTAEGDPEAILQLEARLPDWARPRMGLRPINIAPGEGEGGGHNSARLGGERLYGAGGSGLLAGSASARLGGEGLSRAIPSTSRWLQRSEDVIELFTLRSSAAASARYALHTVREPEAAEEDIAEEEDAAPEAVVDAQSEAAADDAPEAAVDAAPEAAKGEVQQQDKEEQEEWTVVEPQDQGRRQQQLQQLQPAVVSLQQQQNEDDVVLTGSAGSSATGSASLRLTTPGAQHAYYSQASTVQQQVESAAPAASEPLRPRDLFRDAFDLEVNPSALSDGSDTDSRQQQQGVVAEPPPLLPPVSSSPQQVAVPPLLRPVSRTRSGGGGLTDLQRSLELLGDEWEAAKCRSARMGGMLSPRQQQHPQPQSARLTSTVSLSPCARDRGLASARADKENGAQRQRSGGGSTGVSRQVSFAAEDVVVAIGRTVPAEAGAQQQPLLMRTASGGSSATSARSLTFRTAAAPGDEDRPTPQLIPRVVVAKPPVEVEVAVPTAVAAAGGSGKGGKKAAVAGGKEGGREARREQRPAEEGGGSGGKGVANVRVVHSNPAFDSSGAKVKGRGTPAVDTSVGGYPATAIQRVNNPAYDSGSDCGTPAPARASTLKDAPRSKQQRQQQRLGAVPSSATAAAAAGAAAPTPGSKDTVYNSALIALARKNASLRPRVGTASADARLSNRAPAGPGDRKPSDAKPSATTVTAPAATSPPTQQQRQQQSVAPPPASPPTSSAAKAVPPPPPDPAATKASPPAAAAALKLEDATAQPKPSAKLSLGSKVEEGLVVGQQGKTPGGGGSVSLGQRARAFLRRARGKSREPKECVSDDRQQRSRSRADDEPALAPKPSAKAAGTATARGVQGKEDYHKALELLQFAIQQAQQVAEVEGDDRFAEQLRGAAGIDEQLERAQQVLRDLRKRQVVSEWQAGLR